MSERTGDAAGDGTGLVLVVGAYGVIGAAALRER
jgi:hypothetical protein